MTGAAPQAGYFLIESQGRWAGPGWARFARDAVELARAVCGPGRGVWLFLVQDGVTAALPPDSDGRDTPGTPVTVLLDAGGQVWADQFSLAQRAIRPAALLPGVEITDMDKAAAKILEPGIRAVWH